MRNLKSLIPSWMNSARTPGLSLAVIRNGEIEDVAAFGIRDGNTKSAVEVSTLFEAASLSKPLLAHIALQLVDGGSLTLDEPLSRFVPVLVPDDPRCLEINARQVLAHTTGLPNWRSNDFPLRTYFKPGARFSYSGEGFVYLQSAIEQLTGETLETLARRLVFGPFGMHQSSFLWQERFEANFATPHDEEERAATKFKPAKPNAAYSLHTTAADYACFVIAVLRGSRLGVANARQWLAPQVHALKDRFAALDTTAPETDQHIAWGLGWGIESGAGAFFHWGAGIGATAFVLGSPAEGSALIMFANSDTGLSIVPGIVDAIMPGKHPSLAWLGLS